VTGAVSAHRLFFPLAAVVAAVAVPLWVAVLTGLLPPPTVPPVPWHGHEMLLGVAGPAIAGLLVARTSPLRPAALIAAWLAARIGAFAGDAWSRLLLPFPLLLAAETVPGLLRGAKQWSNLPFVLVPAGLVVAETAFALAATAVGATPELGLAVATDLVLLLLVLMGGRLVRTATAGLVRQRGGRLAPIGQHLEGGSVLLLLLHIVLRVAGAAPALGGACLVLAGLLTFRRLFRWWTPLLRQVPEVAGLHLGHAWLALGLVLAGAGEAGFGPLPATGLHAAFVGGFGTLTFTVFARTAVQRARLPFEAARGIARLAPLLSVAAVARLAADLLPPQAYLPALWLAAAFWSAAFALLAGWLLFALPAAFRLRGRQR